MILYSSAAPALACIQGVPAAAGYFVSALSPAGRKMSGYTASTSDPEAIEEPGAVWLAYKWDALQPLAGCVA